jgi:hypothetical protein
VKARPSEKGKGRYQLGDKVGWQASSKTKVHEGKVVEVVKYGMYPSVARPPEKYPVVTWPELMGAHYCREHESYVVEDAKGKRWWPRVGNLDLLEPCSDEAIKSKNAKSIGKRFGDATRKRTKQS